MTTSTPFSRRTELNGLAVDLRSRMTDAERKLWTLLRAKRLNGCKFRRQHRIGPYIADFCCLESGLVVELDGGQHAEDQQKDQERTAFLNKKGFRVLRFWDNEVLKETDAVMREIWRELERPR